jgi:hypothetical protein
VVSAAGKLMPKKEILNLKAAPRLEQVGDKRPEQMEQVLRRMMP